MAWEQIAEEQHGPLLQHPVSSEDIDERSEPTGGIRRKFVELQRFYKSLCTEGFQTPWLQLAKLIPLTE